jgi:cell division protein FtsI (penicillin-binding protein 3)
MAAAQMRKMMEGVVLYGTGKPAQLNGYSSGGKTGTAQKIDPATHKYSKTMHIASFAGIAPVNNPVISVAVVIDNPTRGGSYYGTAVSAPVFAEVAQQVLEYLGVRHDIEVEAPRTKTKPEPAIAEDDGQQQGDVNSLFAAINDLPSDDPLRALPPETSASGLVASETANQSPANNRPPAAGRAMASTAVHKDQPAPPELPSGPRASEGSSKAVLVTEEKKLKVPALIGLPVRQVIVQSAAAGLEVKISGNGTVRQQAPAAGTLVAAGTQIVVHCGR